MLHHRQNLLGFYGFQRANDRFYLYQGHQKAPQIMMNMFVYNSKKHDRKQRNARKKEKKKDSSEGRM